MTATALERRSAYRVRIAEPRDNGALRAIAAACPMRGDISLCVTREPDFFALNRLEGERTRVAVAEAHGNVVGCAMVAERMSYVRGVPTRTLYTGDLKVHPTWRGWGVADELSNWVCDAGEELAGADAPMMLTILAGNRAMEQRVRATAGTPELRAFARIRAFSIPLLWPRFMSRPSAVVEPATWADLEEMVDLWRLVAPEKQLAPVMTPDDWAAWIRSAPGLAISDYHVVRGAGRRINGFLAWWDQSSFKQTKVVRYSPRLRTARRVINAVAGLTRGAPLPTEGGNLQSRTALHVCVPENSPRVLRALLTSALRFKEEGCAFVTVGLDVKDPLCKATKGMFAQPTDIGAYILTPRREHDVAAMQDRPLHYDIALV
jgi:hypothetical protein